MDTKTNICTPLAYEEIIADVPVPEESGVRLSSRPPVEEVRGKIAGLLNGRFLGMYQLCFKTHEKFNLSDCGKKESEKTELSKFPTLLQVFESFTSDDLSLASEYQKPALILCPPNKTREDLLSVLARQNEIGLCPDPRISERDYTDCSPDSEYQAFIVEAANRILLSYDSLASSLIERVEFKTATRKPEEWGMSGDLYALLAMQSIVRGQMIDRQTFTILDGEPVVADRFVPVGHCREGKPAIEWLPSDISTAGHGRFRRVLGGRMIDPE